MNYSIQLDMAPHLNILKKDLVQTPFSLKFGKTKASQINKQYDGFLQY